MDALPHVLASSSSFLIASSFKLQFNNDVDQPRESISSFSHRQATPTTSAGHFRRFLILILGRMSDVPNETMAIAGSDGYLFPSTAFVVHPKPPSNRTANGRNHQEKKIKPKTSCLMANESENNATMTAATAAAIEARKIRRRKAHIEMWSSLWSLSMAESKIQKKSKRKGFASKMRRMSWSSSSMPKRKTHSTIVDGISIQWRWGRWHAYGNIRPFIHHPRQSTERVHIVCCAEASPDCLCRGRCMCEKLKRNSSSSLQFYAN